MSNSTLQSITLGSIDVDMDIWSKVRVAEGICVTVKVSWGHSGTLHYQLSEQNHSVILAQQNIVFQQLWKPLSWYTDVLCPYHSWYTLFTEDLQLFS